MSFGSTVATAARRLNVMKSATVDANELVFASWNSYLTAPDTPPQVNTGRLSALAPLPGVLNVGADREP